MPTADPPAPSLTASDGHAAVTARLAQADDLYRQHGPTLQRDVVFQALLSKYARAIEDTQTHMQRMDVVATCRLCAAREKGSCCFAGVEEWYDVLLLLLNHTMGIAPPCSRTLPGQCLFLGPEGCRLKARYAFCVNFLCPAIKQRLGPEPTRSLLAAAGRELACGLAVENHLRSRFKLQARP